MGGILAEYWRNIGGILAEYWQPILETYTAATAARRPWIDIPETQPAFPAGRKRP
jgi:hypothetical protein